MLLSVVIPTYNRSRILKDCLTALLNQDLPQKDYEIIVVDDGSQDDTPKVLKRFTERYKNIRSIRQKNQKQGIARNNGVKKAKGNIVVFIGDNIMVRKDFLTQHLRQHLRHPEENKAVLGLTLWHPRLTLTPFMKWLTNGSTVLGRFGGHQFAYEKLEGKKEADYNFFYTSNISLKRSLLEKFPFDTDFSEYGWEDIELGYRLHKRVGLRLFYNPKALGYRDTILTEDSFAQRMRNIGKSARIIHAKYPELQKVPPLYKQVVFWLLSNPLSLAILKLVRILTQGHVTNFYYYALSKKYFLEGLHNK